MSWSFNVVGRPAQIRAQLRKARYEGMCADPEEGIRQTLLIAADLALAAYPPKMPVKIEANGSQGSDTSGITNQVHFEITPIWGFVE